MPDPRVEALASLVARVEGAACWLARTATKGAAAGALAGLGLWWSAAGDRLGDWWQGSAASVLVLALCLAPALWLLNVRMALVELVELPARLGGVATRRAGGLRRNDAVPAPAGGLLSTMRSVRDVVRDSGDVVGSWGTVAQLVAPTFWLLTLGAFASLPVVAVLAAVAVLARG